VKCRLEVCRFVEFCSLGPVLHILLQARAFESFVLAAGARNAVAAPNKNCGLTEIKLFIEFTIIFLKILNNFERRIYFLIRSFHISAHFLNLWTLLPGGASTLEPHHSHLTTRTSPLAPHHSHLTTPPTHAPASILQFI
jgi:hypothetical protein